MFARSAALKNLGVIGFEPGEEGLIAEHTVFGDLGVAGAELPRRERVEHRRIGDPPRVVADRPALDPFPLPVAVRIATEMP